MMRFICVHGVCHGGWCWEKTREDLEQQGHEVITPDLPLTSLEDDANAVVQILDSAEGPSVLVGHSYGGLVISKAAKDRSDVAHLVYVAAILIGKDDKFMKIAADYPSDMNNHMIVSADGASFTIAPEGAPGLFYQCCDGPTAAAATAQLRPTALKCAGAPPGAEPWRTISSTYVLCAQDKAILPELQREMAKRSTHLVELDTDHSPFYSSRAELAAVLNGVA